MITFKEFIVEIMDKALPYKSATLKQGIFRVRFMVGEDEIVFEAENEELRHMGEEDDEGKWMILFGKKQQGKRDLSFNLTNKGSEFEVFATLKKIIAEFIEKCDPKVIQFSADKDEPTRARLYQRMFAKNMPAGWKINKADGQFSTYFEMIKEALDKPLPYKVTSKSPKFFNARFTAGSRDIEFNADYTGANYWEISFSELLKKKPGPGARETTKLSGSGNEFAVFATVKAIIDQFIKEYHPQRLTIDSFKGEANRAKLYQRMIAKNLPSGWEMDREDDHPSYTTFTLTKTI